MRSGRDPLAEPRRSRRPRARGRRARRALRPDAGDDLARRALAAPPCSTRSAPRSATRRSPPCARSPASARVVVHVGSIAVQGRRQDRQPRLRRSMPDGEIVASYDKIHLFDVDLPNGESWRESATYTGGDRAVLAETPVGLSRPDHLLRRALSRPSTGRSPRTARRSCRRPPASPGRPARRIGTCCTGRGRSRPAPS